MDAAFLALCADPYGEALKYRLWIAFGGYPVDTSAAWPILAVNPITIRKEREFGVVQGQAWQVEIAGIDGYLTSGIFRGAWASLDAGFQAADTWSTVAQGRITRVILQADGRIVLEITDSVMDLLNATLPRDIRFQAAGWVSEMRTEQRAEASTGWDFSVALVLLAPAAAVDETFVLEFVTGSAYKIVLENGNEAQTGTVAADKTINGVSAAGVVKIPAAGWAGRTLTAGDRYVFYTARARSVDELTPVYMIMHLIADFLGMSVYNVRGAAAYAHPWDDDAAWTAKAVTAAASNHQIAGYFARGTSIIVLIQDCLKIVHGSIYPTETGQLGLAVPEPYAGAPMVLNGNPLTGSVEILDGLTIDDSLDVAVSDVVFRYLALGGAPAEYRAVDAGTTLPVPRTKEISIGWELRGLSAESAAEKYLLRYKNGSNVYTVPATLAAMPARVGGGLVLYDLALAIDNVTNEITEKTVDVVENTVTLKAQTDPLAGLNWFILNASSLDGTAVLW